MSSQDLIYQLQEWINTEKSLGREVTEDDIHNQLQQLTDRHNATPQKEFFGLTPEEMHHLVHEPFGRNSKIKIKKLNTEQYNSIPLVRQTFALLHTLSTTDIKLTKLGWLPLKTVAELYPLGQSEYILEDLPMKRIQERDARSVMMARYIPEVLRWTKIRKGVLSLTAIGKKAAANPDTAANEILLCALTKVDLGHFDMVSNVYTYTCDISFALRLLNKYGHDPHNKQFYIEKLHRLSAAQPQSGIHVARIFGKLFYWLGIVETLRNNIPDPEYKSTELLNVIFSFE